MAFRRTLLAVCFILSLPVFSKAQEGYALGWGDNSSGQGNIPVGLTDLVQVSAGWDHSLALRAGGSVIAWGGGTQATVPSGLASVKQVAAGGMHSLALMNDGTVVGWGVNRDGQRTIPNGLSNVKAIAGGGYHSLALKQDGTVVGWGYNGNGQTTIPDEVVNAVQIAAGTYHSIALLANGMVVVWGYNADGQATLPGVLVNIKAVAAGGNASFALKKDGTVVAWGNNTYGQRDVPPGLDHVVAIAAGYRHAAALRSDGKIVMWGAHDFGQTPAPKGLDPAFAIALGGHQCLALFSAAAPSAADDEFSTPAGVAVAGSVRANDHARGGSVSLVTPPAHAQSFDLQGDGSFKLLPEAHFVGTDQFTYRISNAQGDSNVATVTVRLRRVLSGFVAARTRLVGGYTSEAQVTLNELAAAGGAMVMLESADAHFIGPFSVNVMPGQPLRQFELRTATVLAKTSLTVTAKFGGESIAISFLLIPGGLLSLDIAPNPVVGGLQTLVTVRLSGKAPAVGRRVFLTSDSTHAVVPYRIMVPGGSNEASFWMDTTPVSAPFTVHITARAGSAVVSTPVELLP